ncbi:MAG: CoA-binding protein [Candidatus Helarchaeota archaeon]|nr:CoA-binding protein [Candidatus Helarchaeota archaeon]
MQSNIQYFFHPKSVAIIGASDKEYSWGYWIGIHLLEYKPQGKIYVINPRHDTVLGKRTYISVKELPEDIDLAMIIVPAPQVVSTLEECATKGVKAATIISAGFSETVEGKEYTVGLQQIVKEYGIRLQGPNCAGFYNCSVPINGSPLDFQFLKDSPVAFITQSGYVGNSLTIWGSNRNLHIGKYISVGNEADLTITDYVEYFSQDPTVEIMYLYIEGIKDGDQFVNVLKDVAPTKPIVVWKASETAAVRRAAKSHTAHLVGSQGVFQGLMKQLGIIHIRRLEYGTLVCHSLLRNPPLQGNRLAIMMIGAGWGISLTDALSTAGFEVPEFSNELKMKLKMILPNYRVSVKNPIDFGAADTFDLGLLKTIPQHVFESEEVDGFIMANIGDLSSFDPRAVFIEPQVVRTFKRLQKKYQKPIYLFTLLSEADSKSVPLIKKRSNLYHSMDELLEVLKAQLFYYRSKMNQKQMT